MNIIELYLFSEGPNGPVKIGRSANAGARLCDLQTGNPRPLRVVAFYRLSRADAIKAELDLHEELNERALVGEWFAYDEQFMRSYMADFFLSRGIEEVA